MPDQINNPRTRGRPIVSRTGGRTATGVVFVHDRRTFPVSVPLGRFTRAFKLLETMSVFETRTGDAAEMDSRI